MTILIVGLVLAAVLASSTRIFPLVAAPLVASALPSVGSVLGASAIGAGVGAATSAATSAIAGGRKKNLGQEALKGAVMGGATAGIGNALMPGMGTGTTLMMSMFAGMGESGSPTFAKVGQLGNTLLMMSNMANAPKANAATFGSKPPETSLPSTPIATTTAPAASDVQVPGYGKPANPRMRPAF